jgi:hypothetical protein
VKRVLVIAAVYFVTVTQAFGQQGLSEFAIVIEGAGLSLEFEDLPDDIDTEGVWGARAGIALRLGSPGYVEPGIGIAGSAYTVGTTLVDEGFEEYVEDELGHAGVRIPLRAGIRFFPASPFNVRFFGGVALTFLTTVGEENDFELEKDDYNSTLWAAEVGGGLDVYFLTVSAFYEKGLTNLFSEDVVELESQNVKLSGLGGSVGLRFRI